MNEVEAFWRRLGLPGLVDVHVHFLPERMQQKVWAFFDAEGERTGVEWPIAYRLAEPERLALLRSWGVRAFPALTYPHKPGMAGWLTDWALTLAEREPDVVPSATFFPEPSAASYVPAALERGARVFKAHLQVGDYDPRDPLLDAVWGQLADAGMAAVVHCGSGPRRGRFTGVGPMAEVLTRHPRLRLVVAHLGMPEYADFLALAASYQHVHLDTTMAFTAFTERRSPFPPQLRSLLADLADRIVLGTDFPTMPHPYLEQLDALARLDLGDDWLRAVCWTNGVRLLDLAGLPPPRTAPPPAAPAPKSIDGR